MKQRRVLARFVLGFLTFNNILSAQKNTVFGTVKDFISGEYLVGINVFMSGQNVVNKDNFGYYSITLNQNSIQLEFSYVGYQPHFIKKKLTENYGLFFA